MSIESVMLSNHLILCCPLLLLPSFFPSIRVFSNESVLCIRWPKYWSFSFSSSPSKKYLGLISFKIGLLAVQGTLESLLQHHNSNELWYMYIYHIWAPKSLWMVTAAMKLKDTCSFKESYDIPRPRIKKERDHFANKGSYSQSYVFSSSHVWM